MTWVPRQQARFVHGLQNRDFQQQLVSDVHRQVANACDLPIGAVENLVSEKNATGRWPRRDP
jgi:hypothetical protein